MTCNCFTGTAYFDTNGNCACCDGVLLGNICTGGIKSPTGIKPVPMPYITPTLNCNRHQAPRGWKYLPENGYCVMTRLSDGYRMRTIAGSTLPQTATVGNVAAAAASDITSFIQANKQLLTILGIAGAAYYLGRKK